MTFTHGLSTNNYGNQKFIVASSAAEGTHTTLASALAVASSGDTILLRNSVTENVTLVAGVNIVAPLGAEQTPNISITGKLSFSSAGTVTISGVRLTTNSDNFLAITGTVASVVNLVNCYLNSSNATGITNSSTSASSQINITNCIGNLGTTGIKNYAITNASTLEIKYSYFYNTGLSVTADTIANTATMRVYHSRIHAYTSSDTASISINFTQVGDGVNLGITANSTTTSGLRHVLINSGTASALTVGAGATVVGEDVISLSTNANVISGSGTYNGANHIYEGTSTNNITTLSGTSIKGNNYHATAQGATNDAYYLAEIYGGQAYSWGLDNSDSDAWVLSASSTPGTTNVMRVSTAGEINYPLQSAFQATANLQSDVTGDGTNYTVIFANEIFDQNNDFDGTSTFTAPVAGRYQFNMTIAIQQVSAAMTAGAMQFLTTGRTLNNISYNWGAVMNGSNIIRASASVLTNMAAGDTCKVTIQLNSGAKVVDVIATDTNFSGFLAC